MRGQKKNHKSLLPADGVDLGFGEIEPLRHVHWSKPTSANYQSKALQKSRLDVPSRRSFKHYEVSYRWALSLLVLGLDTNSVRATTMSEFNLRFVALFTLAREKRNFFRISFLCLNKFRTMAENSFPTYNSGLESFSILRLFCQITISFITESFVLQSLNTKHIYCWNVYSS